MLVFFQRLPAGAYPQAAGHAEVQDDGAVIKVQQQVLGAARDILQGMASQLPGKRGGHRPAQVLVVHLHGAYPLAQDVRADAMAGGFDLG